MYFGWVISERPAKTGRAPESEQGVFDFENMELATKGVGSTGGRGLLNLGAQCISTLADLFDGC